ncbi:MAG: arylsulfatase [Burkholderiales bacterium]|nr:arylsulfatase [Burkholderiales bacterium]
MVIVVLDDVGFADLGCYGSEIATPRMDALAARGLRYSNFHVTSMCSPTRACLLTGRNAHAAGVGAIAEWANGFPAYQGHMSRRAATAAEMLSEHGYGAYAIGKWHLASLQSYGAAGPHDHWPLGRGFSRWYGFLGGYVDHWHPDLHEDNHPIRHVPRAGYHLSEDLVDHAIAQVRDHVTAAPQRPFFLYLAFGAAHWPLHVPRDYIDACIGRYDAGWDAVRDRRLARQIDLGVVPAGTRLPPRGEGILAWESLPADARRVSLRLQETYAGFLAHTDAQIGRLVDYLDRIGRLDNTLFVVLSDNGASGEGGPTGAVNIRKHMLTEREDVAYGVANLDRIGSEQSFPHYPVGWAQVSNTPFRWYKKNTHGGGVRAPLIMHWPRRIGAAGAVRPQFHHAIDILPTVLDAVGIDAPSNYRGVEQLPVHGISMDYTFDQADARGRRDTQYFEMVGDRAIWHRGWKAVTRHRKGADFADDRWELYRLDDDFSECTDLAAQHPEQLRALVELWWREAERYGVLPLDDRETERAMAWFNGRMPTRFEYQAGMARADRILIPPVGDRSFRIDAEVELATSADGGAILSCGNRFAGYALFVAAGEVVFEYVFSEARSYVLRGRVAAGRHQVAVSFERRGSNAGRFALHIDGAPAQFIDVERTWSSYAVTAGITCGYANAPVSLSCPPPADFAGVIHHVVVEIDGGESTDPGAAAQGG